MRRPVAAGSSSGPPTSSWGDVPPADSASDGDGSKHKRRQGGNAGAPGIHRMMPGVVAARCAASPSDPIFTIGGVPLVPSQAELRRLLFKPGCAFSLLFTILVTISLLFAPEWRESLRLRRIEREQQAELLHAKAEELPPQPQGAGTALPPQPVPVAAPSDSAGGIGAVLTAVLYHDTTESSGLLAPDGPSSHTSVRHIDPMTTCCILRRVAGICLPAAELAVCLCVVRSCCRACA
jgi:hypothetical protein